MRMDSIEAAIAHCNASKLALQGSVFSQNIDRAISISDAMETGTVQVANLVFFFSLCSPPSPPSPLDLSRSADMYTLMCAYVCFEREVGNEP